VERKGLVFWFTGRTSSGKTTIINAISPMLKQKWKVEILDGDELRSWLSPKEGFTKEGREQHIRKVIRIASSMCLLIMFLYYRAL